MKQFAERSQAHEEAHKAAYAKAKEEAKAKYEADSKAKESMARFFAHRAAFEEGILAKRREAHAAHVQKKRQDAFDKCVARARQRKSQKEEDEEEARLAEEAAEVGTRDLPRSPRGSQPWSRASAPPANFTGLVLGCIEAKFCK